MITISETIHCQKPGRLEPHYVRYHIKGIEPVRFQPIVKQQVHRKLRPQVAALYGTNRSPRDRMRHDDRWRGRKARTLRYTSIDPRWR